MTELQPFCVPVHIGPPSGAETRRTYRIEAQDFARPLTKEERKKVEQPYVILGFDTEFVGPGRAVSREDIKGGKAKNRIMSYQFHAATSDGLEWDGICCPEEGDERLTMGQFLVFALGVGARERGIRDIPSVIYLVGHFTRADIPAFADFKDQFDTLDNLRGTFVTVDGVKTYVIDFGDGQTVNLQVRLRDTMLLTPKMSKSLAKIGDLVGVPKLTLDVDPKVHDDLIKRMDYVRANHWDRFRPYAINDALICVRYMQRIIEKYREVTGKRKIPITLTSIGVDLLLATWAQTPGIDPFDVLGKEKHKVKEFNKRLNRYLVKDQVVNSEDVHLFYNFGLEAYHGGRGEQFFFGPCFEDDWKDYDLSSAYPTAMSLIHKPKWKEIRYTTDLEDFSQDELGFAVVQFEFPQGTRYPTMPVRTDNGLVFPLTGVSRCCAPEIAVARRLGANLKILRGIIVPTDKDVPIFAPFIKECLRLRSEAGPKTFAGQFWKEISNSTYGKTAQGLHDKRVYDLRERHTEPLPASRITNPFFAAHITSYVRALLGEIMNALPASTMVFSCTTDGFLTNATPTDMEHASNGPLAQVFAKASKELTGKPTVLEVKHQVRQPLGWRTRGQATLKPGLATEAGDEHNIVLAKGGIFTPSEYDTEEKENQYVVDLFFNRTPEHQMEFKGVFTGMRDIVENDADLVEKFVTKRLSMEFDWKRRPLAASQSDEYGHVYFTTQPWHTVEQFQAVRNAWEDYNRKGRVCIKTLADFESFALYVDTKAAVPKAVGRYVRRENGDIERLRLFLCAAWHAGQAGFTKDDLRMTAPEFALLLSSVGIPCRSSAVENGKKKLFVENLVPATPGVKQALAKLQMFLPHLRASDLLYVQTAQYPISIRPTQIATETVEELGSRRYPVLSEAA